MTAPKTYRFEPLPQTIRVPIGFHSVFEFYALVVPNPRHGLRYRDFYLVNEYTGETWFLFGLDVDSNEHAAELAVNNAGEFMRDITLAKGQG